MNQFHNEIIDSVGIEIEFSCFDRNADFVKRKMGKLLPEYKRAHDASCETPILVLANTGLPITFATNEDYEKLVNLCGKSVIGGEIISPIRNSKGPDWIKEVNDLCELLEEFGEEENSSRDSFHVHVNVTRDIPLFAILNLLKLTLTFEAILFRLGGMGRVNRGEENNYCYQRPYLGNGPPVIWYGNMAYPILNVEDLLASRTKGEFFDRYGDANVFAANRTRYVTMRYMCVNFYPILTQGSFEFRTANKTLNPAYIISWTNLCKALVEKAFSTRDEKSFEDISRPLAANKEISENELIRALSYLGSLDQDTISQLVEIWNLSPVPKFDNIWRYTHLQEPTLFTRDTEYRTKPLVDVKSVQKSAFIDFHNLERKFAEQHKMANFPVGEGRINENRQRIANFELNIPDGGFDLNGNRVRANVPPIAEEDRWWSQIEERVYNINNIPPMAVVSLNENNHEENDSDGYRNDDFRLEFYRLLGQNIIKMKFFNRRWNDADEQMEDEYIGFVKWVLPLMTRIDIPHILHQLYEENRFDTILPSLDVDNNLLFREREA